MNLPFAPALVVRSELAVQNSYQPAWRYFLQNIYFSLYLPEVIFSSHHENLKSNIFTCCSHFDISYFRHILSLHYISLFYHLVLLQCKSLLVRIIRNNQRNTVRFSMKIFHTFQPQNYNRLINNYEYYSSYILILLI